MSNTYHLPNDTGWSGSGNGGSANFRFEIVQSYDQSANKSTLSITLQIKLASIAFIRDYALQAGSISIAGSTTTFSGTTYSIIGSAGAWATVRTGGSTATWTKTIQHNNDGSATIAFGLNGLNLYSTSPDTRYIGNFGTKTATLSLQETPGQPPTVGTPTASVVDLTGNFPSTYISGYSKVKVRAAVSPYGTATISNVKLSYPGGKTVNMSLNSGAYEATTAEPITGNTTFTVTATDSNGRTASKTVSVTGVVPYTMPTISIDEPNTFRCNSSGTKTDGGTHYKVKATASYYSALTGNSIQTFTVQIKGSSTTTALTSGSQSSAISGMPDPKARYTIVLKVQDKVSGVVSREFTLEGMMRNFVLQRTGSGTQLGIGTTPTSSKSGQEAGSFIELPTGGLVIIGSICITDSSTNPGNKLAGTWTAISQSAIPGLYFWLRS